MAVNLAFSSAFVRVGGRNGEAKGPRNQVENGSLGP